MKKAILLTGMLFCILITMPSYAQKTSKVEEKGVSTPDHTHAKVAEKSIAVPDFWHNSNSKNKIERIPAHLYFNNAALQIKSNKNGLELSESGSSSVYAKLTPTPKEGLYRYTSSTINGAAHFDAKGNLVLKYLDNDTGKTKEVYFQSK
ncbi:hypothetical protein Aeqsu_2100 [Aequorivita sublithincola DSM 14238]|uniref:MORN repeat protein n=1 Tax=Aequorivita sublithincola (strain DSM 14238 / LMG 21431 / ACAM 643 / 9-3) TaxID=746697 RepID=I3YX45_AEQSU|nr:hypothetical protein [Aequorivita sublithincola]AFL81563.1 hypothetical protein Aeqsu_2100 [Aequorivita sublithincola DSM 14238]